MLSSAQHELWATSNFGKTRGLTEPACPEAVAQGSGSMLALAKHCFTAVLLRMCLMDLANLFLLCLAGDGGDYQRHVGPGKTPCCNVMSTTNAPLILPTALAVRGPRPGKCIWAAVPGRQAGSLMSSISK